MNYFIDTAGKFFKGNPVIVIVGSILLVIFIKYVRAEVERHDLLVIQTA